MTTEEKSPNKMTLYKVQVTKIRQEAPGTRSYFFDIPDGVTWEAGADIHIAFDGFMGPEGPDKTLIRHMSVMTLPMEGKIAFTTRVPGSGSFFKTKLAEVKVGDALNLFKIGNRIPLRREDRPIVLVSMGVGVATMRPMVLSYKEDAKGITNMTNIVVDRDQIIFKEELDGIEVQGLSNQYAKGRKEFAQLLSQAIDKANIYYIVGSDTFVEQTGKTLLEAGIDPKDIEVDFKPNKKAAILGL